MIRELRLRRFGRFAESSFAFAPVTAFLGPNESGKSTIFDALFFAVCRPPGTLKAAKELKARYGAFEPPEIEWDGGPPEIEAEEYLNLLAIRSGAFSVVLDDRSQWLQRVKSELFSGGLDPNRLVEELAADAAETGTRRAVKLFKEKKAALERVERELGELSGRRDEVLERQRRVEETAARLQRVEAQAAAAAARVAEAEAHLAQQRLIRERERHARVLADLQKAASARAEAAATGAAPDEAPLAALGDRLAQARSGFAAAEAGERQARDERERAGGAAAAAERELAEAAEAAALAAELRRAHHRRWPVFAALGAAAVAAAALLAVGLWALAPVAVVAAVLLLLAASRGRVRRVQEEWRVRGAPGASGELAASRWEALLAELRVREGAPQELRRRRDSAAAELAGREAAQARAAADAARRREELAAAGADEQRWLREVGAVSVEDYHARRARRLAADQLLAEAERRVGEARAEYACSDDDALRAEVDRRLRELDAVIVEAPLREPEARRLESERAAQQAELVGLTRDRETLKESVDQERGGIKSSLGELPQRIVAKEQELAACRVELARLECYRKAAAIARDLFAEIARDSDVLMEQLASEIGATYGDLVGGRRGVSLAAFDVEAAAVVDAGGEPRDLAALSSGTRDLFLLAARLALAARSRPDGALVVLDEPFQTIDDGRAERSLALLKRFHEERGWQIVLFSKDQGLAPRLAAAFPRARVHRLARDAAEV